MPDAHARFRALGLQQTPIMDRPPGFVGSDLASSRADGIDPTTMRIIVIGAGITGLSAAHCLLELAEDQHRPIDLTLLEASDRPGGVIHTTRRDGFVLDVGPDNFVTDKPWAVQLSQRLGIDDQLQGTNEVHRSALVVRRGRLLPIPEGFLLMAPTRIAPFVFSPLFSWRGKLRMALERFIPARRETEDESLASFVSRRLGREALDRLVQPLIGGIYGADPQTLSLRATMPRFLEMEARDGSIIKAMRRGAGKRTAAQTAARYSLFVTFRQGMQTLVDALVNQIGRHRVRLGTAVTRISPAPADGASERWQVHLSDGSALAADGVILACPTYRAAQMLKGLDDQLARQLEYVPYSSSAIVYFGYRRDQISHPLDAFGFVVPHIERRHIMACSFSSVKYPGRAPQGHALLRVFLGGALQPHVLDGDDADVIGAARRDIDELLSISGEPMFANLHRWHNTMAQYQVGHLTRVAAIRNRVARHPRLQVAGNGFEGVGIPDCVRDGQRAAERMMSDITAKRTSRCDEVPR